MSLELRQRIFDQLDSLVLTDPHTHINALNPASQTLADILGYHYYTELAHSTGMPREQIEEPGLDPKEKVRRLIERMGPLDNTIQYSWFIEMCQAFFGFEDRRVTLDNWEPLYDRAAEMMAAPDWTQQVMAKSKLEAVFLTNEFDDPLDGFDTSVFIPCLRTDDLVFQLAKPQVQERLAAATGVDVTDANSLRYAIGGLFQYFKERNARACAISLPPDFSPVPITDARADTAIAELYRKGTKAHESQRKAVANFVFWTLAQYCAVFRLPFDLMIGVNRSVYPAGVHQGMDLYDSRVSLIQYKELFNAFPQVMFPISVLASVTNQELVSYAWIFPNVVANGHWWYSNTPTYIEHDCAARLEAIPRTKQIGYYSDMYKMEFALPKFAMYKRILAKVLAERFVIDRGWSEEEALALGTQILRGNTLEIFAETPMPELPPPPPETIAEDPMEADLSPAPVAAAAAPWGEETVKATEESDLEATTDWPETARAGDESFSFDDAIAADLETPEPSLVSGPDDLDLGEEVTLEPAMDMDAAMPERVGPAEDDADQDLIQPVEAPADEAELPFTFHDPPRSDAPVDNSEIALEAAEEEPLDLDDIDFESEPDNKRTS